MAYNEANSSTEDPMANTPPTVNLAAVGYFDGEDGEP